MSEQFSNNIPEKSERPENHNEQSESMSLVDKTVDNLAKDEKLMQQYIEKALGHASLKRQSPQAMMKTMVLLYIEDHYVDGPKRSALMDTFENIVKDNIKQIFSQLWEQYIKIFPAIAKKHSQDKADKETKRYKKKWSRADEPDQKRLAGDDKDQENL